MDVRPGIRPAGFEEEHRRGGVFRQAMGDKAINMTADVGIGRLATPDEMAPAMLFLGSSEATYVNGVNLVIDGGFSAAAATGQVDFAKYLG